MPAMRLLGRIGRKPRDEQRPGAGSNTKIGYLTDTDLFRGLDAGEMEEVARMTTMTTCKTGRVFYTPGESGEVLFILKKGSVQLYRISPDGKRLVIGALRAGAVFGEMGLIGQGMYDTFAEASEDCTLCVMSRADVEMLVASKPAFAIGLLELMGQRLQDVESTLERFAFHSVASRLASLLLALRDANDEVCGLSHQNLADRIGTHRETATRALNDFRGGGIIEIGREQVRVVDVNRLRAIADGPSP